jgi:hypothetical protein
MTYCTVREIIIIVTKTSCGLPQNCYCDITRKVTSVKQCQFIVCTSVCLGSSTHFLFRALSWVKCEHSMVFCSHPEAGQKLVFKSHLRFHSNVQLLTRGRPGLQYEPPVSFRWPHPKPSDPPHTEMKWSWGYGPPFKGIVGGHWHKSVCGMTMWSDIPAPRYAPEWLELMCT